MDVLQTDPFILETNRQNTAVGKARANIISVRLIFLKNDCSHLGHSVIPNIKAGSQHIGLLIKGQTLRHGFNANI
ncbi:hypothetical protein DESC_120198 [Desulfosarcina cetonica]|nr:hypothetical protein DESC_120198 [Desulfosarcina cetonica]